MKVFNRHGIHKLQRQVHAIYQDEPVWMVIFGDVGVSGDYNTVTETDLTYEVAAARAESYREYHPDVYLAINFFQEQALRDMHIPSGLTAANTNAELIAAGYRRTSNKYGLISRIDRPDWIDVIIVNTHQDAKSIQKHFASGSWQDHYRRCYSKDKIELGTSRGRLIPGSNWDAVGYIKTSNDGTNL